jgi:hypothetical protein
MLLLQITLAAMNVYLRPDAQRLPPRDFASITEITIPWTVTSHTKRELECLQQIQRLEQQATSHTKHERTTKHLTVSREAKKNGKRSEVKREREKVRLPHG